MTRNHWINRCAFSALATLAVSAGLTAAAQTSVVHYSLDQPVVNQSYVNYCNGEHVLVNGTMHYDYFFSHDTDNDHTDYHLVSSSKLSGVGETTGAQYVGNYSTSVHTVTKSGAASDLTSSTKTRLVSQGPTPDMFIRDTMHVVMDTNGNIHADRTGATISCK